MERSVTHHCQADSYYPSAMILTLGAGPCACPGYGLSPDSADMSFPAQGNHGGIAPTILPVIITDMGYYYPTAMILAGGKS